jgi:anti-sigma regulatory factor (Ser/Thr protein kinase)
MGFNHIDLELDGRPTSAAAARTALSGLAAALPLDLFSDMTLLVSELVANSIRHAGVGDCRGVRLSVTAWDDGVRVEVRDSGPGFALRRRVPAVGDTSGRGLFLVDKLADRWGVDHDEGTCVWFELAS